MHLQGAVKLSEQASVMVAGCHQLHEEGALETVWATLPWAKCFLPWLSGCLASTHETVTASHAAPPKAAVACSNLCWGAAAAPSDLN